MTKTRLVAISLIVFGIAILAVATVLPVLLPTSLFWTTEQAREQATAASRLHQMMGRSAQTQISATASEADKLQARQELETAQARFDASRQALNRAQFWNRTLPAILRWTSGGVTLLGVLMYFSATSMKD